MRRQTETRISRTAFLLPVAALVLLTGLLLFGLFSFAERALAEDRFRADCALAGRLLTLDPTLSGEALAEAFDRRESTGFSGSDEEELLIAGETLLASYGYTGPYTGKRRSRVLMQVFWAGFLFLLLAMTLLTFLFYRREKRRAKEVEQITGYVRQLNDRQYDMMLSDNSEEDLSLLRNEIYKTTVILKEVAEHKTEETLRLSRSLEDISHQLRTPLASISIMIDNICDDPDMPPDLRNEFLKDISSQVTWISELVNSLLTLAKFDAGTIVLKQEEISAEALLKDADKRLGILLDVRDVHPIIAPSEKEILFSGDYKWQLEAISNIIKNCAEHSPAGAKLSISAEQNGIYTCITVRDEGEGISGEDLRHIFERFYKAKNSRPESIGIGLSLAKSIVEAGRGFITVESEVGKGSTFFIKYMR